MARSASPSRIEHFVQGQHDIKSRIEFPKQSPIEPARDLHDSSSLASTHSTTSQRSSPSGHSLKEQLSHCLRRYQSLARGGLNPNSAKEAIFWCCLGLGVAVSSLPTSPTRQQSPLSAGSRSGSNNSLATVSDSGFAPSIEISTRHGLSLGDPDVEYSITNLIGGLAGVFTSQLLERHDLQLYLPDVGHNFDTILSHLDLAQDRKIDDLTATSAKIASQLLDVLRNEWNALSSGTGIYWELCLKLVASSSNERDVNTSNALKSQLIKHVPPPSLVEPALSYIIKPLSPLGELNDSTFDINHKTPHFAPRFQRQTRSRAASLMSHSSLRSFSSVRSLGSLSAKSPATLSMSHDFGFGRLPIDGTSPSGSFVIGSPVTALGALDSLAQTHQVPPRRSSLRRPLHTGNDRAVTAPNSPTLSRSTSNYFTDSRADGLTFSSLSKGKGKENQAELPQEGLRPGAANVSARTGTRFVVTCPPTPSGLGHTKALPKMDPILAALERGSKFKSKSVCLNCGKTGSNYPCCPRCGETWCSRECRIEANNGGKHVCKRSATLPSA